MLVQVLLKVFRSLYDSDLTNTDSFYVIFKKLSDPYVRWILGREQKAKHHVRNVLGSTWNAVSVKRV